MELQIISLILTFLLLSPLFLLLINNAFHHQSLRRLNDFGALPPGPRRWPLVGNIFQVGRTPPHESFARLAAIHGPIMTIWLGSMSTVVLSSRDAARTMFKDHDTAIAGRKIYEAMKGKYGNEGSITTAQYSSHWRMLRRLCKTELFVNQRGFWNGVWQNSKGCSRPETTEALVVEGVVY